MKIDSTAQDFEQLWDYDRPAESESRFRAELARAAPESEAHSQLLTQIARTHSLRGEFREAHELLDDVEKKLPGATVKVGVRYALERGRTFNSAGDKTRAKTLFLVAWERASAEGLDFYAIDAAHMMAFVTPPAERHQWNLKALALTERTADARAKKWEVSLYNNIGWTYHDQADYPAALAMFEKAQAAAEARGRPGLRRGAAAADRAAGRSRPGQRERWLRVRRDRRKHARARPRHRSATELRTRV